MFFHFFAWKNQNFAKMVVHFRMLERSFAISKTTGKHQLIVDFILFVEIQCVVHGNIWEQFIFIRILNLHVLTISGRWKNERAYFMIIVFYGMSNVWQILFQTVFRYEFLWKSFCIWDTLCMNGLSKCESHCLSNDMSDGHKHRVLAMQTFDS